MIEIGFVLNVDDREPRRHHRPCLEMRSASPPIVVRSLVAGPIA